MNFELRPYQDSAMRGALGAFHSGKKSSLIVLPTGCHAKGEKVLLSTGETILVENVKVGDKLMGEDGSERVVLCLHQGKDDLYKITPIKGEPFVVNSEHILTLQKTRARRKPKYPCQIYDDSYKDISVKDYLNLSKTQKHLLKLVSSKGVDFVCEKESDNQITIDPYFLGVLIGDGYLTKAISITTQDDMIFKEMLKQSNIYGFDYREEPAGKATTYYLKNKEDGKKGASLLKQQLKDLELFNVTSGEKFIPYCYKTSSRKNRLDILAGILDTDGHISDNCYDYTTKSKQLAEDIVFICRSVGLRAHMSCCKKGIKSSGFVGEYYRVCISGDTSIITCKLKQSTKRQQIKSCNRTGFKVEYVGKGEYFGFTVNRDNRYLLPDFIITHNCGKTATMASIAEVVVKNGGKVLFLAHRTTLVDQGAKEIENATGIKVGSDKGKDIIPEEAIVVSTVQAMSRPSRLEKYGPNYFALIMIDESHHIPASSYQKVMSYFSRARVLGVTATPKRGDRTDVSDLFEGVSSEYTLFQAIKDGWLSPIKTQTCPIRIDMSKCEIQSGDYAASDVGEALLPYLDKIADEIIEKAKDRKTIIFVPLVSTAKGMVEIFKSKGVEADYVAGERKDSEKILKDYSNGRFNILVNSLLLTEGYNEPSINCVVNLRVTKSEALYCLDEKTEILTPNGFKSNIEVNDLVGAFDIKTNEIKFVPALETIRRPLNEDEYFCSIQTPRTDIRVTNKHRMVYDNKRGLGWKFKTAEELSNLKDCNRIPVSGNGDFKGVPLTNDEIKFIGWVMTDGCIVKKTNTIKIYQASHQPWIDDIEKVLQNCGLKYGKHISNSKTNFNRNSDNIVFTISKGKPRGTQKDKRGWGYLEEYISKDISKLLFEMSDEQFEIMLETINLADGGKIKNQNWEQHSYHIAKGNKTFIENLQMLAIMRGYLANISVYTKNRKNPLYILHIKKQRYVSVGGTYDSRPTWTKEEHTNEMCWCVQNELGTLVTRRNGKIAIVGNCQIIGRGTRLSPKTGKTNLLVLDFLWKDKENRKHLNAKSCIATGDSSISDEELEQVMRCCECEDVEPTDVFEGIEKAKRTAKEIREEALARAIKEANDKARIEEKRQKQREDQLKALSSAKKEMIENGVLEKVNDHLLILKDEFGKPTMYEITKDQAVATMGLSEYYPMGYAWEFEPPTEQQMKSVQKLGFPASYIGSKGHCSYVMNALFEREKQGLCSYKQLKMLIRYHLGDLSKCTRQIAKKGMDILNKNHWRPTSELYVLFKGVGFEKESSIDGVEIV